MPSRKLNEYLDAGASDDERSFGHDSDDAQESKGRSISNNRSKRQKTSHESSDQATDDENGSIPKIPGTFASEESDRALKPASIDKATSKNHIPEKQSETTLLPSATTSSSHPPSKPGVIYLSPQRTPLARWSPHKPSPHFHRRLDPIPEPQIREDLRCGDQREDDGREGLV
ncbi:MAG: hypothetical protein Q9218_006257 [Villophora microphyllina]